MNKGCNEIIVGVVRREIVVLDPSSCGSSRKQSTSATDSNSFRKCSVSSLAGSPQPVWVVTVFSARTNTSRSHDEHAPSGARDVGGTVSPRKEQIFRLLSVRSRVSASQSNVKAFKLTFPASFVNDFLD